MPVSGDATHDAVGAFAYACALAGEGGGMLLFRYNHITLDGYRVRAVPGAVTPLAATDGEWTHQIELDTRHGPRVLTAGIAKVHSSEGASSVDCSNFQACLAGGGRR